MVDPLPFLSGAAVSPGRLFVPLAALAIAVALVEASHDGGGPLEAKCALLAGSPVPGSIKSPRLSRLTGLCRRQSSSSLLPTTEIAIDGTSVKPSSESPAILASMPWKHGRK